MTDTRDRIETANNVITALRQGYEDADWRAFKLNEGDTRSLLICPVLKALGYEARYRKSEDSGAGNRPDECLFVKPVTNQQMPVAVFVEAKPLGTDFDAAMKHGRADSPTRQIQRYLVQHPASDLKTIGILTDGFRWRIYERASETDNRLVADLNLRRVGHMRSDLLESTLDETVRDVHDLVDFISRQSLIDRGFRRSKPMKLNPADVFFGSFLESIDPTKVLEKFLGVNSLATYDNIAVTANLQGKRKDLHDNDWFWYAYTYGPEQNILDASQASFDGPVHIPVAAVHFTKGNLARNDVALTARVFEGVSPGRAAIVIAYARPLGGSDAQLHARLAVTVNGQVSMTPQFELQLPLPSARKAVAAILEIIRNAPEDGILADKLLEPLAVSELQQRFYREVAAWVERHQIGKPKAYRQAVLQHLIRLMFTWILKESNQLPSAPFDAAFVENALGDLNRYHDEMLTFLFHERLNVERDKREPHEVDAIERALSGVPYLNGSLFMRNTAWEGMVSLNGDDYWSSDVKEPGIYTILARYYWTLDENRPGIKEQTLDPELLSNLFERLIAPTDVGHENLKTMPGGTYYTPPDVADEMVKDALSAATSRHASGWPAHQLRALFDHENPEIPGASIDDATRLREKISSLEIFDPAVGSGAFLFSVLTALKVAVAKLGGDLRVEQIIGHQLFGQDIHPLAVQITKLRLFIAIQAERMALLRADPDYIEDTPVDHSPLPNLEARVVCADTLATTPDPVWSPFTPNQLDGADAKVRAILSELAALRSSWFSAHAEEAKMRILAQDAEVRDRLSSVLQSKGGIASPDLLALTQAGLLSSNEMPAAVDPRLLFYAEDRDGFDVVIGNPPYERLFRGLAKQQRDAEVKKLKEEKGYRTTNIDNLYSLFCEVGLSLARENGVVTMIMPLSVAFGNAQRGLRRNFEARCRWIETRHYDNQLFSSSPMVSSPANRQRTTIVTAHVGTDTTTRLATTGLMRWGSSEREACLASRPEYREERVRQENVGQHHGDQWPRIPSDTIARLLKAIDSQMNDMLGTKNGSTPSLTIPQTAYRYLSVVPLGAIDNRDETPLRVSDTFDFRLAMAAANSHVAFAWWMVYGDAFHVKQSDFLGFCIPDAWFANPEEPIQLGQQLIDSIPECMVETRPYGEPRENANFHTHRPDLIEQIDKLYIAALGLPEEPLLTHLRIMRSNSSWRFNE